MNPGASEFARVVTDDGSITLAHPTHGQACHSRAGAWTESRERYASACRVRERALAIRAAGGRSFRLLDVGTGLGLNLAAALEALAGTDVALEATSLEVDARVIEATLALGAQPLDDLERVHAPVRTAFAAALSRTREVRARHLDSDASRALDVDVSPRHDETPHALRADSSRLPGRVRVPMGTGWLDLVLGDGTRTLPALPADVLFDAVFLDPFSPGVDPPLWRPAFLSQVASRMARGAYLSTYTASAAVRAALMASGLAVGPLEHGLGKASGTLAARGAAVPPFEARLERKLRRRADRIRSGGEPASDGT